LTVLQKGTKRFDLVGDAVLRLVILDEWFPSGAGTGKHSLAEVMLLLTNE